MSLAFGAYRRWRQLKEKSAGPPHTVTSCRDGWLWPKPYVQRLFCKRPEVRYQIKKDFNIGYFVVTEYSGLGFAEVSTRLCEEELRSIGMSGTGFVFYRSSDILPDRREILDRHPNGPKHLHGAIEERLTVSDLEI